MRRVFQTALVVQLCLGVWAAAVAAREISGPVESGIQRSRLRQTAPPTGPLRVSRQAYRDRLEGFWLGQCIGNWTGLVTEMDKIGGDGPHGDFYTREDWGRPDQPSIWSQGKPSDLSPTIDFVLRGPDETWGADDDTDIEYIYHYVMADQGVSILSAEQIRDAWLRHIYSDDDTPFRNDRGEPENYLWVSNQRAYDLMREGLLPPATGDPSNNPHFDMIDAQLTTESFGLLSPGRPDAALRMAWLPIRTTARGDAASIAEFYLTLHALAVEVDPAQALAPQLQQIAATARQRLPSSGYAAAMYDFVLDRYRRGDRWEETRDAVHRHYQLEQADGYDISSRGLYCNGCFAAGINFAASLISFFYGEGDFKETIKIAALAGWDADNPAATWGGLLGSVYGRTGIETKFGRPLANRFDIHRTRRGFPNDGIDDFETMARRGLAIIDRVVRELLDGAIDEADDSWLIPPAREPIEPAGGKAGSSSGPLDSTPRVPLLWPHALFSPILLPAMPDPPAALPPPRVVVRPVDDTAAIVPLVLASDLD